MGLLDNLGGLAGLGGLQGMNIAGNPKAALIQGVLGMLARGNQTGGFGGLGGLGGLLQRFKGAGLGGAADSWVGTGANQPVSPDQVRSALGDGQLSSLAQHAGVSEDDAASHLSGLLPQLVDRLTPNGQLPPDGTLHSGGMSGAIEALGHLLGGR